MSLPTQKTSFLKKLWLGIEILTLSPHERSNPVQIHSDPLVQEDEEDVLERIWTEFEWS